MGIAPDSILGEAVGAVTEQMDRINDIGTRYSGELSQTLSRMANITIPQVSSPGPFSLPTPTPPAYDASEIPAFTAPTLTMPTAPGELDISDLLSSLDFTDLEIPDAPVMAPITIPEAPGMADFSLPVRPDIDTTIILPDAPAIALPEMEELVAINLPVFEFPELPAFDATPPDPNGISVPNVFINWSEPAYESENLDELHDKVKGMMAGGTGLPAPIEDALFSRARERTSAETSRAVQEAVDTFAARNFSMPPGMLTKAADVAREQGRQAAAEINRDILIEAAKWEIENVRFAVTQGIALEQLTTNLFENMVKRLFEAARFQAESEISVFNARITLFNSQNAAFETLATVYKTKLEAALSKLTAYKTAVEGQVALGQINQQKVDVFKARLESVQSGVEVYKALVQGAQVRAETIKNQFDAYRSEVQAYSEQVNAEKVKFDAYDSRVKGETAKANLFDAQARAYASTVQAVANRADIQYKKGQLKLDAARTKITKFLADVDVYKATMEANLREVQYSTTVFQSQVEAWRAQAAANTADAEMQSRYADMAVRTNIAFAEMQISEYTAKMQNSIQQANIALEAMKAAGSFTAQLAAGALSAAHVSASISGSGSASSSDSRSTSTSTSHNYNYG